MAERDKMPIRVDGSQPRYCVLGAGLMGKAVAYDLLKQKETKSVVIADKNRQSLEEAKRFLADKRLSIKVCDGGDLSQVEDVLKDVDSAVGAMHYSLNKGFTQAAIKTRTHLCDLGGNSKIVDEQLNLDSEAKAASMSVIPDCGLAPGLVSVLVKWGLEKFNWADTVKIRVGGLPQNPEGFLKYERLFSTEGLINEYVEPVRILRNGEIQAIEPLTEIEDIEFPAPYGKLEAFTTSGGVSTLVDTYKNRLKNLDYKTIRYPGHCEEIKKLQKEGKLTKEYLENELPLCTDDIVLVKIIFEGDSKKYELVIIDKATDDPPFTAMMRTTAFSASIISQMQARGEITELGVKPQERCVQAERFISELQRRDILIKGV